MYVERKERKPFEKRVFLSSPTMHERELDFMKLAFESNMMTSMGENIERLEEKMAELVGLPHALALSSGTAAIHLAVKLAGVKPGDRVFCSDLTFAASANPILYEQALPIFIDSEQESWNMDPRALDRAFELYPDVKTVILAELYGTPAKTDEIVSVCKRHGATLIEDSAEALGAFYKKRSLGSFGDYGIISFNGNKIITGSSGGMLFSKDRESILHAKKYSTQSREPAVWYQHTEIGYNYRMSNLIAGVVRGQLMNLDAHVRRKREIYERYKSGFSHLPIQMNPFDGENSEPNFWLSSLVIDRDAMAEQAREDLDAHYTREKGKSTPSEILDVLSSLNVEARPIWKPMHMQPLYKSARFVSLCNEYAEGVSGDIFERGLCLPSDIKMQDAEQELIIDAICDCFE